LVLFTLYIDLVFSRLWARSHEQDSFILSTRFQPVLRFFFFQFDTFGCHFSLLSSSFFLSRLEMNHLFGMNNIRVGLIFLVRVVPFCRISLHLSHSLITLKYVKILFFKGQMWYMMFGTTCRTIWHNINAIGKQ
jgi:hypothetical protein